MKKFIKEVFKKLSVTLVSSFLFIIISIFLFQAIITTFVEQDMKEPESGSFLVLNLSMNLTDRPTGLSFEDITEEALTDEKKPPQLYLREVVNAISKAASDPAIRGILIKGGFIPDGYGSGYSAVCELIDSLVDFKLSGKPIIGFYSTPSQLDYLVYSICDELHMNPSGTLVLKGLANEQLFFANAFAKYGVGIQVVRVGDFKGAVEPFTSSSFSEENRMQIKRLLNLRWNDYVAKISSNREIDTDAISKQIKDSFIITPKRCLDLGLTDQISTWGEVLDRLLELGIKNSETKEFSRIELVDYVDKPMDSLNSTDSSIDKIAVVYIEGVIVDGWGDDGKSVGGDEVASRIREIRKNDSYKAIILRVNTPGGSVSGAESILSEISEAKEGGLPIIVSMGSVAASGGYWISMSSDQIFASEQTITGSIGVFGLIPNLKQMSENFGLQWDVVKTHNSSDIMGISRPKSDMEIEVIQSHVERIYDRFINLVSINRDLNVTAVDKIAQGRVWMGVDAIDNGLVDQEGGLFDAIDYASDMAGISNYEIVDFPKVESPIDAINEIFAADHKFRNQSEWSGFIKKLKSKLDLFDKLNDPLHCYSFLPWFSSDNSLSH